MGVLEKFRRLATVIQDSNDAITFQDLDGNILAWNRGAERIYGYSQSEALEMNIVDTVPVEYQEEAREFLSSLKRGDLVPTLETKRKTKDGRIVDVWLTNTKLVDDQGQLTGVATTERDITLRKQTEASLREKARELEFLREGQITLSDKMRGEQDIADLGQSVLSHLAPFLNAQMGAFYSVTEKKTLKRVSGYAYSKFEKEEKTIAFGEGLIGQAALGKRTILLETVPADYFGKIRSDLGASAPRSLLLAPVSYEGTVNGVIELASFAPFSEYQRTFLENVSENIGIAINTSISRKKQQELLELSQVLAEKLNENNHALSKTQSELEGAIRIRDEFMSMASHELKTPLTSLKLHAQFRKRNLDQGRSAEFAHDRLLKMFVGDERQLNQIIHLIDDMLDVSRMSSGKLSISIEQFDLCEMVRDLVDRVAEQFAAAGCPIHLELSEAVIGSWDRFRLEQVVTNLLSNAMRYAPQKPIVVQVKALNGRVQISVLDQGRGVAKENQGRIFQRFERAVSGAEVSGLGLGLYIVSEILEAHQGAIRVESELGQGAKFVVELPLLSRVSVSAADLIHSV